MNGIRVGAVIAVTLVSNLVFAGDQLFFKAKTINTQNPILFGKNISISSFKSLSKSEQKNIKYFIVQFNGIIGEREKNSLLSEGFEIAQYIPDNAFIVRGNFDEVVKLNSISGVKWIGRYEPELRGDANLLNWSLLNEKEKIKVVVNFFNAFDLEFAKEDVNALGTLIFDGESSIVVEVERGNISKIVSIEGVEWVEKFYPMQSTRIELGPQVVAVESGLTGLESGVTFLGLNRLYENGFFGGTEIVGIADTGLDIGVNDETIHPDVRGRIVDAQILGLWSESWADPEGHGTHVTGSVLGNGAASNGLIKGGAPEANLVFQSLLTGFGGLYVPPDLSNLFRPTARKGATVHSNSWGNPLSKGEYTAYSQSVDEYVFKNQEFLPVFAAGNEGIDTNCDGSIDDNSVIAPGTAKNALTVGASEGVVLSGGVQKTWGETKLADRFCGEPIKSDHLSNNAAGIAAFSSRGPTNDGRIKPDIVAPGTNVLSLKSQHPESGEMWGLYNGQYAFSGGTSMATPLASGSILILRQYLKDKLQVESVSAALLKATVINSAKDLFPGQFGDANKKEIPTTRPNAHEGWGRIDLESILEKKIHFVDDKTGLKTGGEKSLSISAYGEKPLKLTLVYSDAPGSPSASKALVNDLDLILIGPNGEEYYPNQQNGADRINNVEGLDILSPSEGPYKITIKGHQVPKGPQPFALVISGEFEII